MARDRSPFVAWPGRFLRHQLASVCVFSSMMATGPLLAQESSVAVDVKPYLIERPPVEYPLSQILAGVESAKVLLRVKIDSKGKATVLEVVESPHEDFTRMALAFAEGCRFTPALKEKRPVAVQVKWPLLLRPGS